MSDSIKKSIPRIRTFAGDLKAERAKRNKNTVTETPKPETVKVSKSVTKSRTLKAPAPTKIPPPQDKPTTKPPVATPDKIPTRHQLEEQSEPVSKKEDSKPTIPKPVNSGHGSTIITDTKANRFKLFPSIVSSVKSWFKDIEKDRQRRKTPTYSVPETTHRKGVIQSATSKTGTIFSADNETIREQIRLRNQSLAKQEHEEDESDVNWSPYTEPGYDLLEAPEGDIDSTKNVVIEYKRKSESLMIEEETEEVTVSPKSESKPEIIGLAKPTTKIPPAPIKKPVPIPTKEKVPVIDYQLNSKADSELVKMTGAKEVVVPAEIPKFETEDTQKDTEDTPKKVVRLTDTKIPDSEIFNLESKEEPTEIKNQLDREEMVELVKKVIAEETGPKVEPIVLAPKPVEKIAQTPLTEKKPIPKEEVPFTPIETSYPVTGYQAAEKIAKQETLDKTKPSPDTAVVEHSKKEEAINPVATEEKEEVPTVEKELYRPEPAPDTILNTVPPANQPAGETLINKKQAVNPVKINFSKTRQLIPEKLPTLTNIIKQGDTNSIAVYLLFMILIIVLIITVTIKIIGALNNSEPDTEIETSVTSILPHSDLVNVTLTQENITTLPELIKATIAKGSTDTVEVSFTSGVGDEVTAAYLFGSLQFDTSSSFQQSITTIRLVSVDNIDPLLLMKFVDRDTVFGGLLKWEETMSDDLRDIYNLPTAVQTNFTDRTIEGIDVRILLDSNNEEVLVYGFINSETAIVTADSIDFLKVYNLVNNN